MKKTVLVLGITLALAAKVQAANLGQQDPMTACKDLGIESKVSGMLKAANKALVDKIHQTSTPLQLSGAYVMHSDASNFTLLSAKQHPKIKAISCVYGLGDGMPVVEVWLKS